jgi:vacuolar iron transporter family protein
MKLAIKRGISFGLTSGIITTLGLIIGLSSTTNSKIVIIGGILTIAIADAFSDALGNHMSEEAGKKNVTKKEIWSATISTFVAKFIFAMTFLVPVIIFDLNTAVIISIIWGLTLIAIFSYYVAKSHNQSPSKAILEHLSIAVVVIILTHFVGNIIGSIFGTV